MTNNANAVVVNTENIKNAGDNAVKAVTKLEDTSFGQKIPLEIDKLTLKELNFLMIYFNIFNSIAIIIMAMSGISTYGDSAGRKVLQFLQKILPYSYVVLFCGSSALNLFVFYTSAEFMVKFAFIASVLKVTLAVIIISFKIFNGFFMIVIGLFYMVSVLGFEFIQFFYMAVYVKRVNSEGYDKNGEPIKLQEEVQKPAPAAPKIIGTSHGDLV